METDIEAGAASEGHKKVLRQTKEVMKIPKSQMHEADAEV